MIFYSESAQKLAEEVAQLREEFLSHDKPPLTALTNPAWNSDYSNPVGTEARVTYCKYIYLFMG